MNDQYVLTLHCPQCRQLSEIVAEGSNLVCLDCGWRFADDVAARVLGRDTAAANPFELTVTQQQPASVGRID